MLVFNPLTRDYASQLFATIGKSLYLNSESADVDFVFESNGECERVPAHKAHLMAGSDVFATMFNGSWKENKEVRIGDSSAAAFKEFLQFFYFGQVKLTMENVAAVMNLGEMYNVTECLAVCSKFLKNNLNVDNVCRFYDLAALLNQKSLEKACEAFIGINSSAVFKSTGFLTSDQNILNLILDLDWLSCTEVELFEACLSWVKTVIKQEDLTKELLQTHLGQLFHKIRFGSMSLETFSALIPKYGTIFSSDEHQEIVQLLLNLNFEPKVLVGNRVARCDSERPWDKNDKILCQRLISKLNSCEPYQIKSVETTVFSTNETLLLCEFICAKVSKHLNNQYVSLGSIPTNVTIVESDSNNKVTLYNTNEVLTSSKGTRVSLTQPILIRPGFRYEIRLKQNPPAVCFTGALMKSRIELNSGIIIQFHRDSVLENDRSVARGLIHTLCFKAIQ